MSSEPLPKLELSHGDRRCPKCKSIGTYEFISGTVCSELGFDDSSGDYYKTTILCHKCGQHEIIEKADSTSFTNDVVYAVWLDSVKAREEAIQKRMRECIGVETSQEEGFIYEYENVDLHKFMELIEELEGKR